MEYSDLVSGTVVSATVEEYVRSLMVSRLSRVSIAIVGSGLAGLTAAYRLMQRGYTVDVYEARKRVGGRVFSVRVGDTIGELGALNISDGGSAPYTCSLIGELGLTVENKEWHAPMRSLLPFFENDVLTTYANKLEQYHFTSEQLREKLAELRNNACSMSDVLNKLFPDDPDTRRSCSMRLAAYEGASPEILSSWYVETLYHILMGGLSSVHPAKKVRLYTYIKGGNSKLPEALALTLKGHVHTEKVLATVMRKDYSYVLSFTDGERINADIVILAVPGSVYHAISIDPSIISPDQYATMHSLPYGTNAKIVVPIENPTHHQSTCTNGRVLLWRAFEESLVTMYYVYQYGIFDGRSITAVFNRDLPFLKALYTQDVRYTAPIVAAHDIQDGRYCGPVGHSWVNDPYARGSFSCIAAGFEDILLSTGQYCGEPVKLLFTPRHNSFFFHWRAYNDRLCYYWYYGSGG